MSIKILIIVLLFAKISFAQNDIAGHWLGVMEKSYFTANPNKVAVEIELKNDSIISGVTHLYYTKGRYEHHKISGKYNRHDSTVVFTEDSIINQNLVRPSDICFGRYILKLSIENKTWRLEGRWKDKDGGLFACPITKVFFLKKIGEDHNALINSRENDIQRVINVNGSEIDSVKIEVYDNGEIDGDSVTIFFNELILVKNLKLKTTPFTTFLKLDKNKPINKLTFIADNLGEVPPNTALLIITTKEKKYELHMKSNFDKNVQIEFFLTNLNR